MSSEERPAAPGARSPGDLPLGTYRWMAGALRTGLVSALLLLAVSLTAVVYVHPWSSSGTWVSTNPITRYLSLAGLASGLGAVSPEAVLTLGVLVLIATPVVRVITGSVAFFRHGERQMGALTLTVLAMLLIGLFVVGPLVR